MITPPPPKDRFQPLVPVDSRLPHRTDLTPVAKGVVLARTDPNPTAAERNLWRLDMHEPAIKLSMRNGTPYEIQPCVEPGTEHTRDFLKDQIASGLQELSAQSRWQRFASPVHRLSSRQLDYLADLDGEARVAWCAAIPTEQGERGIALARYTRLPDEKNIAEFAVTVIDEFQNQGVGRALMEQLIEAAKQHGLDTLRGYMLPSNRAMIALCRSLDADIGTEDPTFLRADIRLRPASADKRQ